MMAHKRLPAATTFLAADKAADVVLQEVDEHGNTHSVDFSPSLFQTYIQHDFQVIAIPISHLVMMI